MAAVHDKTLYYEALSFLLRNIGRCRADKKGISPTDWFLFVEYNVSPQKILAQNTGQGYNRENHQRRYCYETA